MKIEEKFEHILENSIHQNLGDPNTIGWFYPNESELRHKKLCELMNNVYKPNLYNYELLIEQDVKNDTFWLHFSKIWSVFYDEKGWNYKEVKAFTKERLEQHLKSKGVTTHEAGYGIVEQHLKSKGVTTLYNCAIKINWLEQHLKRKGVTTKIGDDTVYKSWDNTLKERESWNNTLKERE